MSFCSAFRSFGERLEVSAVSTVGANRRIFAGSERSAASSLGAVVLGREPSAAIPSVVTNVAETNRLHTFIANPSWVVRDFVYSLRSLQTNLIVIPQWS